MNHMDIKKLPTRLDKSQETRKTEKSVPKRSFKELMVQKTAPQRFQNQKSVFDLASKQDKKSQEKKESLEGNANVEAVKDLSSCSLETAKAADIESLSTSLSSLIDEMANYVMIESENGVSKTTVEIGMEGSIFEGAKLELDHYDTAPHSFNLQLSGTLDATKQFLANLGSLQTALENREALRGFNVRILDPILNEKSDLYNRGRSRSEKKKSALFKGAGIALSSISKK